MKGNFMVMPIGFSGMGMYGMNSMSGGANFYEGLKQRYGCGHADFGESPKPVEVPIEYVPRRCDKPMQPGFWAKYFNLRMS